MSDGDLNGSQSPPCFKLFGTVIVSDESHQKKRPSPMPAEEEGKDEAAEPAKAAAALPIPCPRCKSRETKFCYYNNYNVNQPRHFCKACHRYWTAGGALRNVPAGSDRRRNRLFSRAAAAGARDDCAEADRRLLRHEQLPAAAAKLSNSTGEAR